MAQPDSRSSRRKWSLFDRLRPRGLPDPKFTGSCPIREHAGDGSYVGRCDFATFNNFCPRHGALEDYPTNDDREVARHERRFGP